MTFHSKPNNIHGDTMGLWRILLHLHLVLCVSLPAPSNVSISSFNLEHKLCFLPGLETPSDIRFTVQILRLRRRMWRPVTACSELRAGQTCDLTHVFKDPSDPYRARVQAFTFTQTSNWTVSERFTPLSDTVLGPPDVSLSGCGNCLLLHITLPTKAVKQLKQLYRRVVLHVQRSRDGAQFNLSLPYNEENKISYLQQGVEYCVSVSVTSLINYNCVASTPRCAFTSLPRPTSSLHMLLSLLGPFCALAFLLVGLVVFGGQLCFKIWRQPLQRTLNRPRCSLR
ncbi:interferon alpha/beta receptor 2-like isoform X3 [Pungitius pungitius]|uniref:interferon alpha/beta receptor 2-like isoform X3 n=1 Tax=Pungitius pungitius TaxID=134920 RepID=UPI0018894F0E|nr:interferon alpha/beta receptor 2-like isoform X3 [Pungitius pungitius]